MEIEKGNPVANQKIVLREESDDWALLFDPDTNDTYGLNPVSVFIWKCLDGKNTIADIVGKLGAQCKDMPDDAIDHVRRFLDELVEKGYARYEA
jgi:SynChlorMet cassette protein ScmD